MQGMFYQGQRDVEVMIDFAMKYVKAEILHLTKDNYVVRKIKDQLYQLKSKIFKVENSLTTEENNRITEEKTQSSTSCH